MNRRFIGYIRVSTIYQEQSKAGLMAQENMIQNFCKENNFFLLEIFQETESGGENNRPILNQAIDACKEQNANLIVAKLDRLSRKLSFIASFQEKFHVPFYVANLGLDVNKVMIYLLAIFAELERDMISKRVTEGIAQKKRNNTYIKPKGNLHLPYEKGTECWQAKIKSHCEQIFKEMEFIYNKSQSATVNLEKKVLKRADYVEKLNERGNTTQHGKPWTVQNLSYFLRKYQIEAREYKFYSTL